MSSKRRSVLYNPKTRNASEAPDIDEFDDNAKIATPNVNSSGTSRINRRLSRLPTEHEKRSSNIQSTAAAATPVQQQPQPNNEQLANLYNNCIKLLNENKINQKNAFQLHLIDNLSNIIFNEEITGRDTNFQVVGCTIDAGSKIYAARVDALHQNTYQMLSGLGHSNQDGNNNDTRIDDDDDNTNGNNEENGEENNNKKEKKRRKVKKSTQIVENLDQITSKLNEDFVLDDDLYFCRISTSIEQEAIEGLLMNKLKYKDESLELLINKDDIYYNSAANKNFHQHNEPSVNIKSLCETAAKLDLYNSRICDDLNKFKFIGWSLDTNDDISRLVENLNEDLEKDRFDNSLNVIDLHEKQQQQQNQQNDNSLHLGFEGDEDIDVDIDTNQHPLDMINNSSVTMRPPNPVELIDDIRTTTIADMTQLLHHTSLLNQSEYSYFNFDKLKIHDLPKHVKAFALKLANQDKNTNQQEELVKAAQGKDRRRKEIPRLELLMDEDRSKFFKVTKKALFLSDRTIETRFNKAFHLESERELDYNNRQLFQIYHRATNAQLFSEDAIEGDNNFLFDIGNNNHTINSGAAGGGGDDHLPEGGGGVGDDDDFRPDDGLGGGEAGLDGNFDIPNTNPQTQQFFTQNGVHEFNFDTQMPNTQQTNDMVLDGDNLVKAPDQVNALYIQYAKKAKNIDAKRLKHDIWHLIGLNSNNKQENELETTVGNNEKDLNKSNNPTVNCHLRQIYKQLRPPFIKQQTFDDLSVSIVFQMLLFLANEHGLRLINNEDGSDIHIVNATDS